MDEVLRESKKRLVARADSLIDLALTAMSRLAATGLTREWPVPLRSPIEVKCTELLLHGASRVAIGRAFQGLRTDVFCAEAPPATLAARARAARAPVVTFRQPGVESHR